MEACRGGGTLAVIPARNEADRIGAAIDALAADDVRVLVVANGCTDGTVEVARSRKAAVLETPVLSGGVGAARRLGMARALAMRPGAAMILTTDADCVVLPGTLSVLRAALRDADAAFGRVVPDSDEFARLSPQVRAHATLEECHDLLVAEIERLRTVQPWNPLPCHGQSPGALIAFSPGTYRATGGFVAVPCHEDRMMAATLSRIGARIARPFDATVRASCRLMGRAPGGMATTIAERSRIDLQAEIHRLEARCRRLERTATRLRVSGDAGAHAPHVPEQIEGDRHVLSFG